MCKFTLTRRFLACVRGVILSLLFAESVLAAPYDPFVGTVIDTYLSGKDSPIAGNGSVFFNSGVEWNVDPRLIVAIAGAESSFGKNWAACPATGFNAWSWFYDGNCVNSPFSSYADGIQTVTEFIRKSYLNKGFNTIPQIESKYCAAGCANWTANVTSYYTQIPTSPAADPADLTFPTPPSIPDQDIWTTSVYSYAPGGGGPGGGLADDTLRIGGWGDYYFSLLQFDLTGLPKKATSVQLRLYTLNAGGGTPTTLNLFRITQYWNWQTQGTGSDRLRLWWADQPTVTPYNVTLPAPTVNSYYFIDITDLYNGWQNGTIPNYGIELQPTNNWDNFDIFASSRNANAAWQPTLIVK